MTSCREPGAPMASRTLAALYAAAALLAAGSLLVTFLAGLRERPVALAFGILVALGEPALARSRLLPRGY